MQRVARVCQRQLMLVKSNGPCRDHNTSRPYRHGAKTVLTIQQQGHGDLFSGHQYAAVRSGDDQSAIRLVLRPHTTRARIRMNLHIRARGMTVLVIGQFLVILILS